MLRQASIRSQRNKGFWVKHAVQIFLLILVCAWLLYQIERSNEKGKGFDLSDSRNSDQIENRKEILKLGRKDLSEGTVAASEKGGREEEENEDDKTNLKEKVDGNEEEEEEEEEENKNEENGDDGGVGDDEIDARDSDRTEEEITLGNDSIDEKDKDNEQKEQFDEENQTDSSKNQEHEEEDETDSTNNRENKENENIRDAREKHYRADDASSAVVRDTVVERSVTIGGNSLNKDGHLDGEDKHDSNVNGEHNASVITIVEQSDISKNVTETTDPNQKIFVTSVQHVTDNEGNNTKGILLNSTGSYSSNATEQMLTLNNNSTLEVAESMALAEQNGTDISNNDTAIVIKSSGKQILNSTILLEKSEESNITTNGTITSVEKSENPYSEPSPTEDHHEKRSVGSEPKKTIMKNVPMAQDQRKLFSSETKRYMINGHEALHLRENEETRADMA